ncbi:MAG: beta-ketoacyl synthase N-terminal-like domain-containing protein [Planctomycetota bacterium]|nr:beta-ketoacyl synthase N-terminal-like domain-containing protein [Planctomycetota bacterium]
MKAEVVVTGLGMVTPLGTTAPATSAAWRAGQRAPRRRVAELAATRLADAEAAPFPQFDAAARLGGRRMLKYMSDAALLGCLAAREAVTDARLTARFAPERVGLFAGTGLAAASVKDVLPMLEASIGEDGRFSCRRLGEKGLAAANPLLSFKILANMPPCLVSLLENIKGPNLIFNPWEGPGAAALVEAWQAVADGDVDAALAGAADNPAHPATLVYLRSAGLLGPGEFPAPAAAYLVFERAERAQRDRQRAYARVASLDLRAALPEEPLCDPLAERMGRTYAAAPAVLLALNSQDGAASVTVCGVDRQVFTAEMRAFP